MKNKKILLASIPVAIIIIVSIIIYIGNKQTFAIDSSGDYMSLKCNSEIVTAGSEIECSLSVNISTIKGQAFQANIGLSEGITFVEFLENNTCSGNNCWKIIEGKNKAVVALTTSGSVLGMIPVGTFKYKVSDSAVANEEFTITLNEAFIGGKDNNNETKRVELEEVSKTLRIASDVNTLSNITLSSGSLKEAFNSDTKNYTAEINEDKISINVEKTDEHSIVKSTLNNIGLHYGTNKIEIKVVSESGIENIYNVSIYRPYEFNNNYYMYDKNENYLYTKNDSDSTTIISNINLPSSLNGKVENNKLIISYGEEELTSINLINIKSNNYSIVDNNIHVGKDTSYEEFNKNFAANGVVIKVYDKDDNEINTGNLIGDYKVKVYYGDVLLEEYSLVGEYYNLDKLIVDDKNKIIKKIEIGTKASTLKSMIDTSGSIAIKDSNNKNINDKDIVKTGDKVNIKLGDTNYTYTVSILGDVYPDGKLTLKDITLVYGYYKGRNDLELYQISASDVKNDSSINLKDISRIYNYYKNRIDSLE